MGTLYYSGMTLKEWQITSPESISEAWIRRPFCSQKRSTCSRPGWLKRASSRAS
jgi:hypothetical protein